LQLACIGIRQPRRGRRFFLKALHATGPGKNIVALCDTDMGRAPPLPSLRGTCSRCFRTFRVPGFPGQCSTDGQDGLRIFEAVSRGSGLSHSPTRCRDDLGVHCLLPAPRPGPHKFRSDRLMMAAERGRNTKSRARLRWVIRGIPRRNFSSSKPGD